MAAKKPSLIATVMSKRDEVITQLTCQKRYIVDRDSAGPNTVLRTEGYNEGLDVAIKVIMEVL